jgi:uncharacterized protein DUF4157
MIVGQTSFQSKIPAKPTVTSVASGKLQRACACGQHTSSGGECEGCKKKRQSTLQRTAVNQSPIREVPPIVFEVLHTAGQPLDTQARAFMQTRLGHDFSKVRVHTDAKAAASARNVNALAYTVGGDIVFGEGQYAPGTSTGRRLLAHELAHTVQQSQAGSGSLGALTISDQHESSEHEAERVSQTLEQDRVSEPSNAHPLHLARQSTPDAPASASPASGDSTVAQDAGTCNPSMPGRPPSLGNCSAYAANSWWLPLVYVNNATCACLSTPNSRTANCVRAFLQNRLAATPTSFKIFAASQKALPPGAYDAFVQSVLTPRIYQDHVDAYANCCCPSGPAPYLSWVGVTTVPIQPCSLVGASISYFGSCHGTPGTW